MILFYARLLNLNELATDVTWRLNTFNFFTVKLPAKSLRS